MQASIFSADDLAQFNELGVTLGHVEEQLLAYDKPPPKLRLARPCTVGDGIRRLAEDERPDLLAAWSEAVASNRVSKFVPASGAATRMFASARWLRDHPELWVEEALSTAAEVDLQARRAWELLDSLPRMPFWDSLRRHAEGGNRLSSIPALLEALLEDPGIADTPKALVPFHSYDGEARTALEEQLYEAVAYLCDDVSRVCQVHFTVAPEHRAAVSGFLDTVLPQVEAACGARIEVELSTQSHATDVLTVDGDGAPARRTDGRLLFRPSGHGALLRNLSACDGDIVSIKNIDNVTPAPHERVALWKKLLIGLAVRTQATVHQHEVRLSGTRNPESPSVTAALEFLQDTFGLRPPITLGAVGPAGLFDWARQQLHRPLRVCGMVANEGEPGGGPFWVAGKRGSTSPQIVEASQVATDDPTQLEVLRAATHFNPVDLVCALRDSHGRAYDLEPFVDPDTAFLVEKEGQGRTLRTLERPGLWNGSMAGWNTTFVEVPGETFAPVKTARDLLRPAHRA